MPDVVVLRAGRTLFEGVGDGVVADSDELAALAEQVRVVEDAGGVEDRIELDRKSVV